MQSRLGTLVLSLLVLSSTSALAESYETKQKLDQLRKENWVLKKSILYSKATLLGRYSRLNHGTALGVECQALPLGIAEKFSLREGEGLKVTRVAPGVALVLFKTGDIILRVQGDLGPARAATSKSLFQYFLPGDMIHFQIYRSGKYVELHFRPGCLCGAGDQCPFYSPYGPKTALPSDDPIERHRRLLAKKYKNIRKLDATAGSGTLTNPNVPVFEDAARQKPAGNFSHDEWVSIRDRQGDMFLVQRRTDKKTAWVEAKYLKAIYSPGMFGQPKDDDYDHVIHQPHHIYKNDSVLVWHSPARNKRKFLLAPGTPVKVVSTMTRTEGGMTSKFFQIQTKDGRTGWVPDKWLRKKNEAAKGK